jgi:hypothetical protein
LEKENEMFSEADLKWKKILMKIMMLNPHPSMKLQKPVREVLQLKGQRKKYVPVSKRPRRNSTRITNKYRLRSKAMFDPSIKKEDVIVIEDHSEDAETDVKQKENKPPLHKNQQKETSRLFHSSTGPVTRATTRLS